jgi:peroxiredoxin
MSRAIITVLLVLLLALTAGCGDSRIGQPAQDFTARDLAGNEVSLSDYRGKVVLLDFWATWCAPCVEELPNVKRVHNEYKNDGFAVIGVSLDNNRSALEAFVQNQGIEWPQVFDGRGWENEVSTVYQVNAIPAMFLIDKEGVLRYTNLRGPKLERSVKKLLNTNPES